MNIVVTGSQGTLGKPLVKALRANGHRVEGIDLAHTDDPLVHRADIAEYAQLDYLFDKVIEPVDYVYNLAAEFGRHNGERYTEQLWRSNAVGLKNLLKLQLKYGFKLIHASSSEVYGNGKMDKRSMDEEMTKRIPLEHHNDYAMSKWVNEQQIANHIKENPDYQVIVPRFFNAYGPGEEYHDYRSVVCLFCYRALHDLPITVYRDYHRVFMYIDDFIPSLVNLCERELPKDLGPINIGGVEYRSIEEVVEVIESFLGPIKHKKYLDQDAHNTVNKYPNIRLAQAWLDHNPTVPLEVGIKKTLEWMIEKYKDTVII
jgi:dTDP-glucose 4,6-dehydratase